MRFKFYTKLAEAFKFSEILEELQWVEFQTNMKKESGTI